MRSILFALSLALFAQVATAQEDGFKRERRPDTAAAKDALEGKPAPRLQVDKWLNSKNARLNVKDLRGKVVVLDFWGTW